MANNNTKELIQELFQGMDGFVQSKTVVGEPIKLGILFPFLLWSLVAEWPAVLLLKKTTKKGTAVPGL